MEILDSGINGLKLIKPYVYYDFRGEYVSTYNEETYQFGVSFKEDDFSISRKNVLRGMHGDFNTYKLVQCVYGAFYIVIVDYRENSETYLKYECFALNDKNRYQLLIPPGCANGHLCLSDMCIFSYKQSRLYSGADKQFTLRWDDPLLAIHWPVREPILSQRDTTASFLKDIR